ncbi:MAG: RNA 2',3'-cyclic phosphodiesterase [Phycisphaerae bacterium]
MRTFIAIDFDADIQRCMARVQRKLEEQCPTQGLRWTDTDHVHLTLQFLGEIADQQVAATSQALDDLAGTAARFEMDVGDVGVFPPKGPVRVIWVGIHDAHGELARLHTRCQERLATLGFPPERRAFSPHLTLARNRNPRNSDRIRAALSTLAMLRAGTQTVDHVTFYQSTLTKQGPIHEALSRHRFAE